MHPFPTTLCALAILATCSVAPAAIAKAIPADPAVHAFIVSRAGRARADALAGPITVASRAERLPPLLVAKLINRESSFRAHARSGSCAGLMQVDRRYYFRRGENPVDVHTNLRAGCRELAACHHAFPEWERALTAYNAGKSVVARRGIRTSRYARQVLAGR